MDVWILLTLVLGLVSAIIWYRRETYAPPTQESYYVADRNVDSKTGTVTLTANWFQAPATLLSGNLAFAGTGNFLMFFVPNVIAMILPGFLVEKITAKVRSHYERTQEHIYTVPQYIGIIFGPGARFMFFVSGFGALIGAMSYTLSGLSQWLEPLGINTWHLAIWMALVAYAWVYKRGIEDAVKKVDKIKICALGIIVVGAIAIFALNWGTVSPGQALRIVPDGTNPFMLYWTWGLALGISLLGGFFCNPDLGERSYVGVKRSNYFVGATIFGFGVAACGLLGLLAWHLGINPAKGELVTFALLKSVAGGPVLFTVGVLLLIVLTAAFASMFASAADLLAVEFISPWKLGWSDAKMINASRVLMILPILIAGYLATRDKNTLDLGLILLSLAVIRGQAIVPMFLSVFAPHVPGRAIFLGMATAFVGGTVLMFGAPVWKFTTGEELLFLAHNGSPLGALVALFSPLVFALPWLVRSTETQRTLA